MEKISLTVGRILLGFYFLLPGITKIDSYEFMGDYMALHNIPFVSVLLPITILLQVVCGLMLITGYRIKETALVLAGLTLLINFGMHDFWNSYPETDSGHETQNFVKNLGIFAGLLAVSASNNLRQWRLFGKEQEG
jgi:putative oxidoreductase|tara:strand:- start:2224 stop:2631 length:408 start_codon:yes stop_codon:yes gene_type:complete